VKTEARKVELLDDFRPKEAHHVGAHGELESREDFLGDRGAAQDVAALEHQDLPAGARQVGGVDQAVVAAADDDDVVVVGQ
jgi:hypothetical protein